jgi:hypothetical protein
MGVRGRAIKPSPDSDSGRDTDDVEVVVDWHRRPCVISMSGDGDVGSVAGDWGSMLIFCC